MKLIMVFFSMLILGMGDPTFLPSPKKQGLIPENQTQREPAEKKPMPKQQEEERAYQLESQQQRMAPHPLPTEKIK